MKLLVTGGCGFLGSNLAAHGIAQGHEITIFDNLYREGSRQNLAWLREQGSFRFVHGDIRNSNDVMRAVQSSMPERIFHLAGQVAMTTSIADPRMDFEVNALGTLNLLEAVRQQTPEAGIIYSSTNKVYGDLEQFQYVEERLRFRCIDYPRGFAENTQLDFHSPYGCSKGAADQYLMDYHRIFGLRTVVFRHSSMYGGRQFATYDQGWIGWFCQMAAETEAGQRSEPFTISGTGKQVRDVLHAEDMISLYYSASSKLELVQGRAFNIGGGIENSLSLLELFAILEAEIGCSLDYRRLPARESDQRFFVADLDSIQEAIGWTPRVSSEDGVLRMLSWIRDQMH